MYFNVSAVSVSTTSCKLKTFFLFCDNEEIWSDLPLPFSPQIIHFIFRIKILGRKAIYWQKRNKHSRSSSSAHYSSPEPAGLQGKAEPIKKILRVCTRAHPCARGDVWVLRGATMCSTVAGYNPRPLPAARRSFKNISLELKTGGHGLISLLKHTCS